MATGLINLGNTCYFNSVLQILANVDLLIYYLKNNIHSDLNYNVEQYQFIKELHHLLIIMNNNDKHRVLNPTKVFSEFNKHLGNSDIYGNFNQEDSEEVLLHILDLLHNALKYNISLNYSGVPKNNRDILMVKSLDNWSLYYKNNYSNIIDIFYGQYISSTVCNKCNNQNNNFEPCSSINIQITPQCNTLDDCFDLFTNSEKIEEYKCDKCNEINTSFKKLNIWKSPKTLIIVLKRFNGNIKLQHHIKFPLRMNLEKYVTGYDKDDSYYVLNSIIEHQGDLNFGHYVSYIIKDKIYKMNDNNISTITNINNIQAYILVYKKINCHKESNINTSNTAN